SGAASATLWRNGDEITYNQSEWGNDPAASILINNYGTVYLSTGFVFEIGLQGAGFSADWTDPTILVAYLPASGAPGALDADLIDPTSTSSGQFGGDVAALKLNIDFSDAGITLGNSGIAFGDLILANLSLTDLNGLTVRQFLGVANTALGGGTTTDTITELDALTIQIDGSFFREIPSAFAQDHLIAPATPVPEPSS